MAKKRPLRTTAYRGGKEMRHGRASTLTGAILSATRRLITQRISAVVIMSPRERVLAEVFWKFGKDIHVTLNRGYRKWK